jgi:hypothetical protein
MKAGIPILPVPATGGAAARVKLTADNTASCYKALERTDSAIDTHDLVAALLEAVERYTPPAEEHGREEGRASESSEPVIPTQLKTPKSSSRHSEEGKTAAQNPAPTRAPATRAFIFGVAFVCVILAIALFVPSPSAFQYTVFRVVLALAAAGIAAEIPGILNLHIPKLLTGSGALGVFAVVYFYSPANLAVQAVPKDFSAQIDKLTQPIDTLSIDATFLLPDLPVFANYRTHLSELAAKLATDRNAASGQLVNLGYENDRQTLRSVALRRDPGTVPDNPAEPAAQFADNLAIEIFMCQTRRPAQPTDYDRLNQNCDFQIILTESPDEGREIVYNIPTRDYGVRVSVVSHSGERWDYTGKVRTIPDLRGATLFFSPNLRIASPNLPADLQPQLRDIFRLRIGSREFFIDTAKLRTVPRPDGRALYALDLPADDAGFNAALNTGRDGW